MYKKPALEAFPYVEPNCKSKNNSWLRGHRRHDCHGDPAKRPGVLRAEERLRRLQPIVRLRRNAFLRSQKITSARPNKNPRRTIIAAGYCFV